MGKPVKTAGSCNRSKMRRFVAGILCFLGSSAPVHALAQGLSAPMSSEYLRRAAAEALFDEAKSLMAAKRPAEACPKFAASQAMDPAVGTMLNLADCLEKLGRTASAWAEFRAAAAAARAKGQLDRAEVARKRAIALERELVRLTVVVAPGADENLQIRKNGTILERGSWGVALPVDPGRYVIEASISGKNAWQTSVEVPDKPGTVVTASIPLLEDSTTSRRRIQRGLTITLGTVSVFSLVAGGVFGAAALSRNSKSRDHCIGKNLCDDSGVALRQDAVTFGNASTAAFIVGAATGASAIILHLTTPPTIPPTNLGFSATTSGVGLIVGGQF